MTTKESAELPVISFMQDQKQMCVCVLLLSNQEVSGRLLMPSVVSVCAGCSVNKQNGRGYTPLHRAASKGNLKVIKYLLLQGQHDTGLQSSAVSLPSPLSVFCTFRDCVT